MELMLFVEGQRTEILDSMYDPITTSVDWLLKAKSRDRGRLSSVG